MSLLHLVRGGTTAPVARKQPLVDLMKSDAAKMSKIPMLPDAAMKALAVAKNPDCSLTDLARIIERDLGLAAGILKLVNSPLYRTGRAVESLEQAVVRLGLRECQNMILTVGMRSMFRNVPPNQQQTLNELWRHSFVTATTCRHLNRAMNVGFRGEEFAAGIAHDLGRILIVFTAFEDFRQVDPLDFSEGFDILERERTLLGTDHCYFGAWYASLNQLPESIVNVIQYHHTPAEDQKTTLLTALVATADHMANHLQRDEPIDQYVAADNPGAALLELHALSDVGLRFSDHAIPVLEAVHKEAADMAVVAAA